MHKNEPLLLLILMRLFTFLYLNNFVSQSLKNNNNIIQKVISTDVLNFISKQKWNCILQKHFKI